MKTFWLQFTNDVQLTLIEFLFWRAFYQSLLIDLLLDYSDLILELVDHWHEGKVGLGEVRVVFGVFVSVDLALRQPDLPPQLVTALEACRNKNSQDVPILTYSPDSASLQSTCSARTQTCKAALASGNCLCTSGTLQETCRCFHLDFCTELLRPFLFSTKMANGYELTEMLTSN